jgi:hypothetical protein
VGTGDRTRQGTPDHTGAHLIVDCDGSIGCLADLVTEATYHATSVNHRSIGIEIHQTRADEIFEAQLDAVARLVWAILSSTTRASPSSRSTTGPAAAAPRRSRASSPPGGLRRRVRPP